MAIWQTASWKQQPPLELLGSACHRGAQTVGHQHLRGQIYFWHPKQKVETCQKTNFQLGKVQNIIATSLIQTQAVHIDGTKLLDIGVRMVIWHTNLPSSHVQIIDLPFPVFLKILSGWGSGLQVSNWALVSGCQSIIGRDYQGSFTKAMLTS